ncbi:hypothetical protein BJY00DRAFT_319955 [Aspergillus carlsbadensis]|nr:hypothetical protein BJY00DRAFT_319955 [Aspergillus carlsbadensis]
MYLATAASAASLVVAGGMGWGSIKAETGGSSGNGTGQEKKVVEAEQGETGQDQEAGGLTDVGKADEKIAKFGTESNLILARL